MTVVSVYHYTNYETFTDTIAFGGYFESTFYAGLFRQDSYVVNLTLPQCSSQHMTQKEVELVEEGAAPSSTMSPKLI